MRDAQHRIVQTPSGQISYIEQGEGPAALAFKPVLAMSAAGGLGAALGAMQA